VKLTDQQKEAVARWADEDEITLGEIQKRLKTEFQLAVTYLETRFLLEDEGIELKTEVKAPAEDKPEDELDEVEAILNGGDDDEDDDSGGLLGAAPGGKVSVTVDEVAHPSAMVSGKVAFSDGHKAAWFVDQMGRLALDPSTPGHRPSEADIMAFQTELQRVMGRL
jgi:hypothetical protein